MPKYKRPAKTVTATLLTEELMEQLQLTTPHYLVVYPDGSQKLKSQLALDEEGYLPIGRRSANGQHPKPKTRKRRPRMANEKPEPVAYAPEGEQ